MPENGRFSISVTVPWAEPCAFILFPLEAVIFTRRYEDLVPSV